MLLYRLSEESKSVGFSNSNPYYIMIQYVHLNISDLKIENSYWLFNRLATAPDAHLLR